MKKRIKLGIIMGFFALLSGCGSPDIDQYQNEIPAVDVQNFFNGPLKAWGFVQDRSGDVTTRFTIDMQGTWEGDTGTLSETFYFSDGEVTTREWTITKTGENSFEGSAPDVIGKAQGEVAGNAVNWHYVMKLPLSKPKYEMKLNDWMWRIDEKTVMNRIYITKFGITFAEMTIVMQKQD